jgi:hypothetical protein
MSESGNARDTRAIARSKGIRGVVRDRSKKKDPMVKKRYGRYLDQRREVLEDLEDEENRREAAEIGARIR